jgi:hypothetical protein
VKAARSPRAVQPAQQEAVVLRAAPLLRLERALLALEERAQARRVAPKTELVRTALEQRAPEKRRSVLAPVSRS